VEGEFCFDLVVRYKMGENTLCLKA
jgi:hypothetical protein